VKVNIGSLSLSHAFCREPRRAAGPSSIDKLSTWKPFVFVIVSMSVIHARCRCLLTLTRRLTLAGRREGKKMPHNRWIQTAKKDDVDAGNFLLFFFLDFSYRDIELLV
jgi:hypothetical protein